MNLLDFFRQFSLLVGLPAALLAGIAAALIVVPRDWRLVLFSYVLLSVMLAVLLVKVVPGEWALLQALVGGLIAVMLYLSARQLRWMPGSGLSWETRWPQVASLTSFRAMAVALAVVAFVALHKSVELPKVDSLFRDAIVWLAMVGLLGLALHEEPLHAGLALLTVLGGFDLLLFSLTQSRMMTGIALGGQLLLGLAVSYLMLSRGLPVVRPESKPGGSGGQP